VANDDKRFTDTDQQCALSGVSEVQLSQRVDSLRVTFRAEVGALDSSEDLQMRSRSWEDDSRSWRLNWQRQRNLVISTNTPDGGNPEDAI